MLDKANFKKIESFILKELQLNLSDAAIFQHDDKTFELFNKFTIQKVDDFKFIVVTPNEQKTFTFLKNAVMWCTFNKRDKFYEMLRIEELDIMLSSIDVMIQHHKKLANKATELEDSILFLTKMNENKLKKQNIVNELKKYIGDCKHWQAQKFESTMKYFE